MGKLPFDLTPAIVSFRHVKIIYFKIMHYLTFRHLKIHSQYLRINSKHKNLPQSGKISCC